MFTFQKRKNTKIEKISLDNKFISYLKSKNLTINKNKLNQSFYRAIGHRVILICYTEKLGRC